jgi:hypothetical protein
MLIVHARDYLTDQELGNLKDNLLKVVQFGSRDFDNLMTVMNLTSYGVFFTPSNSISINIIASHIYDLVTDARPNIPMEISSDGNPYLSSIKNTITSTIGVIGSVCTGPIKVSIVLALGAGTLYYSLGCVTPILTIASHISKASASKKIVAAGAVSATRTMSDQESDLLLKIYSWFFPN